MNNRREIAVEDSDDERSLAVLLGIASAKLDIVERLVRGPATISELAVACGYTRHGVEPHLVALENIGLVSSEIVRVPGVCRPTRRYVIDATRLEEIRWALHDVLDFTDQHSQRQTA
ncbi:putative ArsR family transcriptional regulator [Microbacterium terrae]|uniref:Uncharacterized protein n=1 Tax=Microbacterium terrae TaxID=69369 RepID=A0A0M2GVI5_9MICO|nr:ArsR family transcriptional regulator [Microbacterium terrae]KJL37527.1 hypothetical protein RS81_03284 [Microbacterium terrae]MBP1076356.1 putative ArsR family transcriptional regulator [Microbacterium terrae]GLJ97180.1 hypothetical protein GCM10017594_03770 [Microbacterium terrae]